MRLLAPQPCTCVRWSLVFVIPSAATLSFIRAPSCGPQTVGVGFQSLETPSAAARGWMISNTWEPWDPTLGWNNRGPVSIRARNRTRRRAVMMSESLAPAHAPSTLLMHPNTKSGNKKKKEEENLIFLLRCGNKSPPNDGLDVHIS